MFGNYLKIAVRTLLRNRIYTAINVLGLAIAVATCLMITTYLHFEFTWDSSIKNVDRVYRVDTYTIRQGREPTYSEDATSLLGIELMKGVPGIESVLRLSTDEQIVRIDNELVPVESMSADSTVADMLGLTMLAGNPNEPLKDLRSVIISFSLADKYFGGLDAVGKSFEMELNGRFESFTITGIYQDMPLNTTYRANMIYPYEIDYAAIRKRLSDTWGMSWSETLVRLAPETDPEQVEAAIEKFTSELKVNKDEKFSRIWQLQPMRQIHVALNNPRGMPTTTDASASIALSAITLIILLIASINFTTLSLGRSTTRTRGVGMRKVLGANRTPLMVQFWVETGLLAVVSIVIGVLFAELSLPMFNDLADTQLTLHITSAMILSIAVLWAVIVFFAGSYPALVISSFRPAQAFKGEIKVGGKSLLRRSLVFIQFTLSISLIALTLIMTRQMQFISKTNLGFNGNQVVVIDALNMDDTGEKLMEKMRAQLGDNPNILSISGSANNVSSPWFTVGWTDQDGKDWRGLKLNLIDPEWLNTLQIPILYGRNLIAHSAHDSIHAVLLNEKAVEYFGFNDPIGKMLPGYFDNLTVVGVIPNLHMEDLHTEIDPAMLMLTLQGFFSRGHGISLSGHSWYSIQRILLRLSPNDIPATMKAIERTWSEIAPDIPFKYSFVDDKVDAAYRDDRRWNSIITSAAGLAIIIALLGLFGLSTLEVSQRRKEIGIRKVLGASEQNIILLLTHQIMLLVVGASIISAPVAYILGKRWLNEFAYRIEIGPGILTLAGITALLLAMITVGGLAWRASMKNPVESIRYE